MIRQPAVAGQFYSASPEALSADVARYTDLSADRRPALAVVSPHAGLMYSGHVAGAVFSRVDVPTTVILLGPNHTGVGPPLSVYQDGAWLIPGGTVPVDRDLAGAILAAFPLAEADASAHRNEHCLEVQLPFLRHARPDVSIVPIVLGSDSEQTLRDLGLCLARLIRDRAPRPLLLVSTDFSHYDPDPVVRQKDRHAIEAIERLDPDGLGAAVKRYRITMCGYAPMVTVLHAVRSLGATGASLIRYATSGDVSGDRGSVVGYAGLVIT
ncbi:MAG: AmmeMemoRadiSam system protein B [Nitrospirota bacterium]